MTRRRLDKTTFRRCLAWRILLAAALIALILPHSVRAEVHVSGNAEAVRIEARDAPVADVLAALGTGVGLQFRSSAPLERRISGTFAGSLRRVLARVLEGYDFVL